MKKEVTGKNTQAKKPARKNYITVLSVLSSFAVVVLHMNGIFWHYEEAGEAWASANVIESLFYFAVPIFFMISGANLIDYRERYDTKTFFKKRFSKVLIPFVFWTIVAILMLLVVKDIEPGELLNVPVVIGNILNAEYLGVFWFFIPLFALYFAMPVLSAIDGKVKKDLFKYMILGGVIFSSILPFIASLTGIQWNPELTFWMAGGYVVYALLGYYYDHYEISSRVRKWIYVLGIAGVLTQIIGTYFASKNLGDVSTVYKGFLNVPALFYSSAIYLFFRQLEGSKNKIYAKLVAFSNKVADTTFGIYLIHMFILVPIERFLKPDMKSLAVRILGSIGLYAVVVLVLKIVRKIPGVKIVLP